MLTLDGSFGEGGGQILRTALALSAITGTPVTIEKIRRGRQKPGLQPQHITGARAVAEICQGKLKNDTLYSDNLTFEPGEIKARSYEFDVASVAPSAGSVSLIIQQVLPVLLFAGDASYLSIKGGTDVAWSPPIRYLEKVFLPTLFKLGAKASLDILRRGFFPIGGGEVKMGVQPLKEPLKNVPGVPRGALKSFLGLAEVSSLPVSLGERELKQAQKSLGFFQLPPETHWEKNEVKADCPGNIFSIFVEYEAGLVGFSTLGEFGKPAEKIADDTVSQFVQFNSQPAGMDKHLADQLLLYLALAAGPSSLTTEEITPHLTTNIWVIEQFLPVKFQLSGNSISVEGAAKVRS